MNEVAELARSLPSPACAWIYTPARLRERAAALRRALAPHTVLYAMKACANPAVLAAAVETVDGVECASRGELTLAEEAGAARLAFSGPAKTDQDWQAAAATETPLCVHAESLGELNGLAAAGYLGPVALRVNRGRPVPGTHRMTGPATPFGIDPDQVAAAAAHARALGLDVAGFHLHAVSGCLDADAYADHVADGLAWSARAADEAGIELRYVNVGGGLGADPRGETIDLERLGERIAGIDTAGAELVFEPGRYLAADSGWYLAEIVDLKTVAGQAFALVRGGTHHFRLPAAWGYSHPFTLVAVDHWPHPWPRPRLQEVDLRVCGELCTPRDVLHAGRRVEAVAVGDRVLFANAGAYGWEISHDRFLAHQRPLQITVDGA
ncbi:type III PLP-dependent enzyme domain-containing protein [Glycomyces xiaoerkulensis]|uniref:decarboxylase n=1 Tax=Glycomyces xiaoerkulensis TaxID=2038139 RepID=UPI000C268352|nr:decarboxylase [Glycomyces xiaoerkulensis]